MDFLGCHLQHLDSPNHYNMQYVDRVMTLSPVAADPPTAVLQVKYYYGIMPRTTAIEATISFESNT